MEASVRLESLRGLHQDLVAFEEGRLRNIDKLCEDIKAHVEAFRKLLDKSQKSDASRAKLSSGDLGSPIHCNGYKEADVSANL